MVPTITTTLTKSQEHLTNKLRKPLVEKLRRERINNSIMQLKSLLGPGLKQQPDSKMEKADILEMTVCILRQLQKQRWPLDFEDHGHHIQEREGFRSKEDVHARTQRRLTGKSSPDNHLTEKDLSPLSSTAQKGTIKDKRPSNSALWRPW
eukprot:XP_003973096.1 PREDICTED: transcription factor HES-5-like [Takifugu rubripes]